MVPFFLQRVNEKTIVKTIGTVTCSITIETLFLYMILENRKDYNHSEEPRFSTRLITKSRVSTSLILRVLSPFDKSSTYEHIMKQANLVENAL